MLNRNSAPAKGLWNGVGGKFEDKESPLECVQREVFEETGLLLINFVYKGVVTWEIDATHSGGMYAYTAEIPVEYIYSTPIKVDEGILDWKDTEWILSQENRGVSEIIPKYLPLMLSSEDCYEHKCILENNKLVNYESKLL